MTERIAIVTGSARGIGAATARRLAADGMAVAVLDLDEAACAGTVKEIADAGGRALAVGADVSEERPGPGRGRAGGRRAGRADRAGEQRRRDPRQPAVQDDRRRLGHGPRRAPARRVPDDQGRAEVHGRSAVRAHRQPVLLLRARQPRPGQLLRGQGRPAGLHQDPGHRARPVRDHRERGRARVHRHRHDRGHRGAGRRLVRGFPEGRRGADTRPQDRAAQPTWPIPSHSWSARARASSPARSST